MNIVFSRSEESPTAGRCRTLELNEHNVLRSFRGTFDTKRVKSWNWINKVLCRSEVCLTEGTCRKLKLNQQSVYLFRDISNTHKICRKLELNQFSRLEASPTEGWNCSVVQGIFDRTRNVSKAEIESIVFFQSHLQHNEHVESWN